MEPAQSASLQSNMNDKFPGNSSVMVEGEPRMSKLFFMLAY